MPGVGGLWFTQSHVAERQPVSGQLNVAPVELLRFAEAYADLGAQTAALVPRATQALQQVIATHGAMGYPVALGIAAGLATQEPALSGKSTDFSEHSRRFTEHADTYAGQDKANAVSYRTGPPLAPGDEEGKDTDAEALSNDVTAVDDDNRDRLQRILDEVNQLPDGQAKTDRLADIAAIRDALTVGDSHLLFVDWDGDPAHMVKAATSVGDPYQADHVSVTVPGVTSTTRGALAGMTREAAELRNEALDVAQSRGETTSVATISWTGYQPPLALFDGQTVNDNLAREAAPDLKAFLADLSARSANPDQTVSLFGHSYGSLVAGLALKDGASAYVDNAVMYGSPGFAATSTAQLGMDDHNFFVMSAPDDPINAFGELAPLHGWGADPNDVIRGPFATPFGTPFGDAGRWRFDHLATGEGFTPDLPDGTPGEHKSAAHQHSGYPRNATEQMTGYNLAAVLLGHPEWAVHEPVPSPAHPRR